MIAVKWVRILSASLATAGLFFVSGLAAELSVTAAHQKDMDRLSSVYWRCRDYNADNGSDPAYAVPEKENQEAKKACDLRDKLARKMAKQGFCFYKGFNVGRPGRITTQKEWTQETGSTEPPPKNRRNCDAPSEH